MSQRCLYPEPFQKCATIYVMRKAGKAAFLTVLHLWPTRGQRIPVYTDYSAKVYMPKSLTFLKLCVHSSFFNSESHRYVYSRSWLPDKQIECNSQLGSNLCMSATSRYSCSLVQQQLQGKLCRTYMLKDWKH